MVCERAPGQAMKRQAVPLVSLALAAWVVVVGTTVPAAARSVGGGVADDAADSLLLKRALRQAGIGGVPDALVDNSEGLSRQQRFAQSGKPKDLEISVGMVVGDSCHGLPDQMCDPCPDPEQNRAGLLGKCSLLKDRCRNSFCSPVCLNLVMECKIKPISSAIFRPINDPAVTEALCAEFKAHACTTEGCCKKDDPFLMQWVEQRAFGAEFSRPSMLIDACAHDPNDFERSKELCDQCKSAVAGKITVQSIVESKDTLKNEEGAEIIDPETSKPLFVADRCSGSHLQSWEPTGGRTGEEAELDYASENRPEGEWPGWGKLKSLKERCQQLSMRFKDSLPAMESDFESRACGCLGCCDDHVKLCPFPVVDTAPSDGDAFDVAAKL